MVLASCSCKHVVVGPLLEPYEYLLWACRGARKAVYAELQQACNSLRNPARYSCFDSVCIKRAADHFRLVLKSARVVVLRLFSHHASRGLPQHSDVRSKLLVKGPVAGTQAQVSSSSGLRFVVVRACQQHLRGRAEQLAKLRHRRCEVLSITTKLPVDALCGFLKLIAPAAFWRSGDGEPGGLTFLSWSLKTLRKPSSS